MMTSKQKETAIRIAKFGAMLLATRMVERSNSARRVLFGVLHEAVCAHRKAIPGVRRVLDDLRTTGPFAHDERHFRGVVVLTLRTISQSPNAAGIADTLDRLLEEARFGVVIDRAAQAIARRNEREAALRAAGEIVAGWDREDRLHQEIARI